MDEWDEGGAEQPVLEVEEDPEQNPPEVLHERTRLYAIRQPLPCE